MALSKCSGCGSTLFETVTKKPSKSNYDLLFIQCQSCGAVVGVMDQYNIGYLLHTLASKLGFKL